MSSLYQRDLRALSIPFGGHSERITVSTLDAEASKAGVSQVDLLKIDTEGADRVIQGAAGMIEAGVIDMLVIEYGGTALDSHRFVRDYYLLLAKMTATTCTESCLTGSCRWALTAKPTNGRNTRTCAQLRGNVSAE